MLTATINAMVTSSQTAATAKELAHPYSVDIAKLAGSENLNTILSADAQLNLDYKRANAYYAAAVVKYKNWFAGFEYKYIPVELPYDAVPKKHEARLSAIEGKIQYTFDTKHSPVLYTTAGYVLDRSEYDYDYSDKGLLLSAGASIKVKEMTVKVEYKYTTVELDQFYGQSKLNFEINFSF